MKEYSRRDFLAASAVAGGSLAMGAFASPCSAAPVPAGNMMYGVLLHLGGHMWGDWTFDASMIPGSPEELAKMFPDDKLSANGVLPTRVTNYLRSEEGVWRSQTELAAAEGLNMVMIDVAEAYAYPSHPELWVKGSWSAEKMRDDLARIRRMGLEPIPKLNFSTGHDQWLKEYHYMTSTARYYQVVADVIRDVAEVFDHPRYFHLGFDEEVPAAFSKRKMMVVRQGDLWWHDLYYIVGQVEKHGSRAMIWSDKICTGKDEFLRRMSKGVLQVPWYYGDFSNDSMVWDPLLEKKVNTWEPQRNLAASIFELDRAGFDIMPCTSNWSSDKASDAMLSAVKKHVDPAHLKGLMTAPWAKSIKEENGKAASGIRLFAAAKRKYYP